ncbi:MAG: amidohydrolase family protein [Gemmatimonadaceae bacterium]|nr:amidohydrolase family protein [Gemmatimonadaceae bacterium]
MSPAAALHESATPLPPIALPVELANVLRNRAEAWNDSARLGALYTQDAIVLDGDGPEWLRGRAAVAGYMSALFGRVHRVTPVAFSVTGSAGYIAGYFSRDTETGVRNFGHVLIALRKDTTGRWRIAAETPTFPGPNAMAAVTAKQLIEEHDNAGIRRGVVHSVAFWFGQSPTLTADEYAKVRAENDWVGQQVALFPDRLVAFCSFNPLKDYALEELARCDQDPAFTGLKLHFGNSDVDVRNPDHVASVKRVFRAANERRFPIAVHLWVGASYGREDATIFLNEILAAAPDIPVQIAHFAGGGPGYTDDALGVYAEAIAAGDLRTRNLYFDIATVADRQPPEVLRAFAARIRQVGLDRVLFGSDLSLPGPNANPPANQSWLIFRTTVPLTDAEFAKIARNVAPYLK